MLPVFLDLAGRRVVVVGGGPVGRRKARAALAAGAVVQLVAPETPGAGSSASSRREDPAEEGIGDGPVVGSKTPVAIDRLRREEGRDQHVGQHPRVQRPPREARVQREPQRDGAVQREEQAPDAGDDPTVNDFLLRKVAPAQPAAGIDTPRMRSAFAPRLMAPRW